MLDGAITLGNPVNRFSLDCSSLVSALYRQAIPLWADSSKLVNIAG